MEALIKKAEAQFLKEEVSLPRVGDTVKVRIRIKEGEKERIQFFEGVVIALKGVGINKSIKVRKISHGVGVEKTVPVHSPAIVSVEILRKGRPRRAKLYYLRGRKGKLALKVRQDRKNISPKSKAKKSNQQEKRTEQKSADKQKPAEDKPSG